MIDVNTEAPFKGRPLHLGHNLTTFLFYVLNLPLPLNFINIVAAYRVQSYSNTELTVKTNVWVGQKSPLLPCIELYVLCSPHLQGLVRATWRSLGY